MIRELDKSDLASITELEKKFGDILNDVKNDLDSNPFSNYLVYLENEKIVGYLNYYLMYERIEIANFNVLEEFQNKRVGTSLIEYLINKYMGKVNNITLEVKSNNDKAIYLYKKMGFKMVAIREKYYNGIDGILMERGMK